MARRKITDEEWTKIRQEYITQGVSGRDLAKKYDVSESAVFSKAKNEQWEEQRQQFKSTLKAKVIEQDMESKVLQANRINTIAGKLLDKMDTAIANTPILTATEFSKYAASLEKIKGILNIRTAEDDEEQRARIEKLRKEAAKEDRSSTITVTMEGDIGTYGK